MKVLLRMHDIRRGMIFFAELHAKGPRQSLRLLKGEPIVNNGDLKYNLHMNFTDIITSKSTDRPTFFVERIIYAQEKIEVLLDRTLNIVNEIILITINES